MDEISLVDIQARIYLFIWGKKDGNSSDILKILGKVK